MDTTEIKSGDTVKVNSGAPLMTVSAVFDYYGTLTAKCHWFEKNKQQDGDFPVAVLAKASPPTGGVTFGTVVRG